jgi:hypothetical protein
MLLEQCGSMPPPLLLLLLALAGCWCQHELRHQAFGYQQQQRQQP